ncbi:hypothetical protein [Spongorhabdus nitratireducens]
MLSSPIESFITYAGASALTDGFLAVLGFVFFFAVGCKIKDKAHAFTQYTPTLLTSLGILGTFMGIVAGLLDFDTAHIDTSIGPLLEGLKTAFITSLSGMLLSILFKMLSASGWITSKDNKDTGEEITAADYLSHLRLMGEQAQNINDLKEAICSTEDMKLGELQQVIQRQADGIDQLLRSIGGNDDGSLLGQLKLLRFEQSDNQKHLNMHLTQTAGVLAEINSHLSVQGDNFKQFENRLWIKLQDFADMMSKSATEQVIEALKSVIQDFNNNLTEQFGENFKHLNNAVLELVTWQENYKHQLADMKNQYDLGVKAISETESSVAHIGEKAQSIPGAMDDLVKVMEVNQHQIEELSRHLGAFESVRDKAVEAVPEIRGQIDMAIAGAREANELMAQGVQESTDKLKLVVVESADNYRDTVDRTRGALNDAATETANSSVEIKDHFKATLEDINNNMRNLVSELQTGGKALNESYINANETLVDGLKKGSEALTTGVTEAGASLVNNLQQGGEAINQSYTNANEALVEGLKKSSEALTSGVNEAAESLVTNLQQGGKALNQSYIDANATLVDGLKASAETLAAGVSEAGESLVMNLTQGGKEFSQNFTAAGNEMVEGLQVSGNALASDITKAGEGLVNDIQQGSKEFNQSFLEVSEAMVDGLKAGSDTLTTGVTEAGESLITHLQKGGKELGDAYKTAGDQLLTEFRVTSSEMKDSNNKLVTELAEGNNKVAESFRQASADFAKESGTLLTTFGQNIDTVQKSLTSTIEQQALEHRQRADSIFAGLEKSIQQALSNTGESVQKQVEMIDQAMEKEVTKVMQSMGEALASISGQFTRDYSSLTRDMGKVISQVKAARQAM